MKKLTCLLLTTALMLCGCDESEGASSTQEPVTESKTMPEYIDEDVTETIYNTLDEFKASEYYSAMKSEGFVAYIVEYDEDRYTLEQISADVDVYKYFLYDSLSEKTITYTITYDSYLEDISQLQELFPYSKNVVTTAEGNGETYDVYLMTSPYDSAESYSLSYIPFDNYKISIHAGLEITKEEILSYFDDFELVADN